MLSIFTYFHTQKSIHFEILSMLPIRNMSQEAGNLGPLDMQEIIDELVAEPGPQYRLDPSSASVASISDRGIGGFPPSRLGFFLENQ